MHIYYQWCFVLLCVTCDRHSHELPTCRDSLRGRIRRYKSLTMEHILRDPCQTFLLALCRLLAMQAPSAGTLITKYLHQSGAVHRTPAFNEWVITNIKILNHFIVLTLYTRTQSVMSQAADILHKAQWNTFFLNENYYHLITLPLIFS